MSVVEPINHHTQAIYTINKHFGDKDIIGIEIGTAQGLLTKVLLMYLPNLKMIYTIDPYLFVPGGSFEASVNDQAWHDDRRRQAEEALKIYEGRYTLLCIGSDEAVSVTPNDADFIWIDGDHSPEQIRKDVLNYYPKVKSGGLFGGHDWNHAINIVEELLTEDITLGKDLTWFAIKK